jgi:nitrogen fixation/metabolism regulation signal transduction histidine kinase
VDAAERLGEGEPPEGLTRPDISELARLSEAFSSMAAKIQERTDLLARERESAVTLLSRLTAAVLLFRRNDGVVVFANQQADETFPGGDLADRLSPQRWEELRAFLASGEKAGGAKTSRVKEAGGDGRLFRAVLVSLPTDGFEPRAVLILEDLTDLLRAERLTAWVDAARAVAHDIKNPLTPIRLAAERLLRHSSKMPPDALPVVESAVEIILRQTTILNERIGRLGRMSDPRLAQIRSMDRDSLAKLLDEVAADYRITGRKVVVNVPADLPDVLSDSGLLRDAVANFVLNSIEAIGSSAGMVSLSAERRVLHSGRAAVAVVCDDEGPGVSREDMGRLFEPGFSTKSRGSGMGLFATRRAIESLGGEVFFENRDPTGLRIGFLLPAVDMIFQGRKNE